MIEPWLQAIRDHPRRPPAMQRHVLTMLALRMDFSTGQGFASTGQLMADADAGESTVRRATTWARSAGLLVQVQRGHRRGDGTVSASQWRISTGRGRPVEILNRSIASSQPVTGDVPSLSKPSLSKLSVIAIEEVRKRTGRTITRTDAERGIKTKLDGRSPNNPAAYLKKIIRDEPRWWLPTSQPPPFRKGARDDAPEPEPFAIPE